MISCAGLNGVVECRGQRTYGDVLYLRAPFSGNMHFHIHGCI